MQGPYKIMLLFGTRAEALKLAPIIQQMKDHPDIWQPVIVTTAQAQDHQLLQQTIDELAIKPDFNLDVEAATPDNQVERLSNLLHNLNNVIDAGQPQLVLVVGDATTTLAASLVSFYHHLPLGHVEAGLRTHDKEYPFPDEMHRLLTDDLADLYFAPTTGARDNLIAEHHPAQQIYVTGNTAVDAVRRCLTKDYHSRLLAQIPAAHRLIILTMQRPEIIDQSLATVLHTVKDIVEINPDVDLIFPLYPDPAVEDLADEILGKYDRVHLVAPLAHRDFINLAARSTIIITDSGTIQEEAPAFHKPVLLLRENTERPEAVDVGAVKIVGTDPTSIQQEVFKLLNDHHAYKQRAKADNPFGDGHASERILTIIEDYLNKK